MRIRILSCWVGLLLAATLAACAAATPVPTATSLPAAPTATTVPTQAASPTVESTPTEAAAATDACIACHTDKDQLISTADQVVEEVEESEGAG